MFLGTALYYPSAIALRVQARFHSSQINSPARANNCAEWPKPAMKGRVYMAGENKPTRRLPASLRRFVHLDTAMAALALLLVLLIAILSYTNSVAYNRVFDQVRTSQIMTRSIAVLLSAMTNAETGQRGYLLTGRNAYLEPYRKAVSQVPGILNTLANAART
jgi:hypothetical protein